MSSLFHKNFSQSSGRTIHSATKVVALNLLNFVLHPVGLRGESGQHSIADHLQADGLARIVDKHIHRGLQGNAGHQQKWIEKNPARFVVVRRAATKDRGQNDQNRSEER